LLPMSCEQYRAARQNYGCWASSEVLLLCIDDFTAYHRLLRGTISVYFTALGSTMLFSFSRKTCNGISGCLTAYPRVRSNLESFLFLNSPIVHIRVAASVSFPIHNFSQCGNGSIGFSLYNSTSNFRVMEKANKRECVSMCTDIHPQLFYHCLRYRHGNHTDRSSSCFFARRWWLGILPLAQELALSCCQEERGCNREPLLNGLTERQIFGACSL
jgi:hypothetical protein